MNAVVYAKSMRSLTPTAVFCCALSLSGCAALPAGSTGASADALAHAIEANVDKAAWDATGAVRFGFRGAHDYVWDKERAMVYVKNGSDEVWLDLMDHGGIAHTDGKAVDDATRAKMLASAWEMFCNDTFWLNPLVKLFDAGTTREIVALDGDHRSHRGLKVTYASGGTTPGDTYVWIVDDKNTVVAVRMWVSVLPIKGAEFAWGSWSTLATGAKVALAHKAGPLNVPIDAPAGAKTLAELEPGVDRFAALVARRTQP